jgi:hypothetical protein
MNSKDREQFLANELYLAKQGWGRRKLDLLRLSSAWDNIREPKRSEVLWWIRDRIVPWPHARVSSAYGKYSLKFEWEVTHDIGDYYVSEGQFKGAMVELGYLPIDPGEDSWRFRAKERLSYAARSKLTTRGRWQVLSRKRTCSLKLGGCGTSIEKDTRSYEHSWANSRFDRSYRHGTLCETCGTEHERRVYELEEEMRKFKAALTTAAHQ